MSCGCEEYNDLGEDAWTHDAFGKDPLCSSSESLTEYDGCLVHDVSARCGDCYYSYYSYECPQQCGYYLECSADPMTAQ